MANNSGAYRPGPDNSSGAYDFSGFSAPTGVGVGFSNGTAVTDEGAVLSIGVAADYAEQAGDVYINGTRHDANGYMYVTISTPDGSEVFINGIAHSPLGVRYVQSTSGDNKWPEGFATDTTGAQFYSVALAAPSSLRGISRDSDGAVLFNT
jgi:hypothetical protein